MTRYRRLPRALTAALLAGAACAAVSCSLNSKVFYTRTPARDVAGFNPEEITLTAPDGCRFYSLFMKPDGDPRATIFLLQGNGGNVTTLADVAKVFVNHGYQVFLMGYRGYAGSQGSPSFKAILRDSEQALRYLRARADVRETKVVALGYSLGGSFAVRLAHDHPELVDALVVEGAFTTFDEMARHLASPWLKPAAKLLVKSPSNSEKLIARIAAPKLIVHSREDKIVPFEMGERLHRAASEPKEFWPITGEHCLGVRKFERGYMDRLDRLLLSLGY
jgi:hypothetical protein